MTGKLYVRKGGDIGAGDIEMTGFTGRKGLAFMDGEQSLIQLGMRCANGEASQGTFKIIDPIAELPRTDFTYNIPAHTLVTWIEDEPGVGIWLSRGRTAQYEGGRGEIVVVDNDVEYDVTVDDGNVELRGQAFTEAWIRPAETDFARIAAVRAYTLNGSGSTAAHHRDTCSITVSNTHLCPNTNTVTMPAKTYPVGTQPQDVIADCADTASKIYSVVIHHTGGSHLCLLYILETDHTTYASAAKITDELSELAPTHASAPIYAPHWEAGKASLYDGQALLSGLVSIYGTDQSVFVDNANATPYDYWVDTFYDSQSVTAAQASTKASGLLLYRSLTNVTHRVSIIMLASQTALVAAGMSIQIKAAAAIAGQYLDTWQTRRIAECQFEPMADGRYWAHLRLDRTPHNPRGGKAQPAATTPKPPPQLEGDQSIRFYRMGDTGGQDLDWPDFAQFQGGGAAGSTYCAFVSGSAWISQNSYSAAEGATYRVAGYCKVGTRFPLFCFYDIGPYISVSIGDDTLFDARIGTPTTLHGTPTGDVWTAFSSDIVAPSGTLSMGLAIEGSGGLVLDEVTVTLLGSGISDPFALASPGTSPYFTRSDDPRLTADDQHLITSTQQRVTNNSGVTLTAGDVVVPDTSIDGPAVTRTTSANSTAGPIGIVVLGGVDDAPVTVMWSGAATFINTNGTPADGDYLFTSTTAGVANVSATRGTGAFGRVVRDDGAGETLSVLLWGVPDAAAGTVAASAVTETTDGNVQAALDSIRGRAWKQPVRVATAAAGTLASSFENGDTVDGVVLATGNRILLKDQAAGAENGIYTVNASGAPTRGTDMDASSEVLGAAVLVTEGTANADKVFICTTNATITLGSTALVFAQIGGGGGTLTVQEDDATVDAAATTLDFTTALNVTSSPAGEANIAVDLGTASTQAAAGNHTHTSADSSKASASADYTPTTTTATDVTGATLSLATGTYIVVGNFDVTRNGATNDRLFEGVLDVGGVDENDLAILSVPISATVRAHAPQVWRVVLGSTTTVKLQARHSGGTAGDFTVNAANTTLTAYVAGGSGTTWEAKVSESGTSFANFTAGSGTWASDGTIIAQTDTAATVQEARFTTMVATGLPAIIEAEIRFPTTGAGGGATRIGGLLLGYDGTTDSTTGFGVRLNEAGDTIDLESVNSANLRAIAFTIAKDVWYKLRAVRGSGYVDIYLDGTLIGTARSGSTAFDVVADYVGLYTFGTRVDFRNIKVWTLSGGLPA